MVYKITAVPKPRQTRRDVWLNPPRPGVARYRAFKDQVRVFKVKFPHHGAKVLFILPMPKSWSPKKRAVMDGKPHQQTPDIDNLIKAFLDALFENDQDVWQLTAEKRWGREGGISITPWWPPKEE